MKTLSSSMWESRLLILMEAMTKPRPKVLEQLNLPGFRIFTHQSNRILRRQCPNSSVNNLKFRADERFHTCLNAWRPLRFKWLEVEMFEWSTNPQLFWVQQSFRILITSAILQAIEICCSRKLHICPQNLISRATICFKNIKFPRGNYQHP